MQLNPMEQFEVKPLIARPLLHIAGHDIFFTNQALLMIIVTVSAALFLTFAMSRRALVPGRAQSMAEMSYEFVAGMIQQHGRPGRLDDSSPSSSRSSSSCCSAISSA